MTREEKKRKLEEVRIAIKTLCFLYPRAAGYNQPNCAGIVLRRFQLRIQDLVDSLSVETEK